MIHISFMSLNKKLIHNIKAYKENGFVLMKNFVNKKECLKSF